MNKKNIVKRISKESGIKKKKCSDIFNKVIDLISKDIEKRRDVEIENFGDFKIKTQAMKIMITKNMNKIVVPPKDIIELELSQNFLSELNADE